MTQCKCGRPYTAGVTWSSYDAKAKKAEELKLALKSAKIVMEYYDKNKSIHPMLQAFASEWLEINKDIVK